jgi:F-type H+-transporting ATPase subunit b
MDAILNQLGGLILGSVPTIIFFLILVVAYGFLVRRPLDAILLERRARTTGAVEQARGAIEAAEAETAVFEHKLRAARTEIFLERDAKLKQWAGERDQALAKVRETTNHRISVARESIQESSLSARQQIETMSGELSAQILRAVLPAGAPGTEAAQ